MSVALIELVEMTATLNVVVSINSTTVMQTYWDSPLIMKIRKRRKSRARKSFRLFFRKIPHCRLRLNKLNLKYEQTAKKRSDKYCRTF